MATASARLRVLLGASGPLLLPGAYDAVSARIIETAGFSAVHFNGAGVSHALGFPDVGLASFTEVFMVARAIVDATELPLIVDADTGFGNAINVVRTVREFERLGTGGLHLEDQPTPKVYEAYASVISREEMLGKLHAALDTRHDPNFVIIARTDARRTLGLEETIARCVAYAEAGADGIFPVGLKSLDELAAVVRAVAVPVMHSVIPGSTLSIDRAEAERVGCKILLFAPIAQMVAACAMQEAFRELHATGSVDGLLDRLIDFAGRERISGFAAVAALQKKYVRS